MNFIHRLFIITGIFPVLFILLGCAGPGISYIQNNSSINFVDKNAQNSDLKVMTANISQSVRYIPSKDDNADQPIND